MRTTRLLELVFTDTDLQDTHFINIPFKVREIRVKSMAYEADLKHSEEKSAKFGFLTSDLTNNTPLGFYHQNSHLPYSPLQNVVYELQNPDNIQGTFTFRISEAPNVGSIDQIHLILEFLD